MALVFAPAKTERRFGPSWTSKRLAAIVTHLGAKNSISLVAGGCPEPSPAEVN
jgi:hypothetical protein